MSLSKYKESGVLIIPGLFQNLCCLACPFKMVNVDEAMMQYVVEEGLKFNQVMELQDPGLVQLYNQQSRIKKRAITTAFQNLTDFHGMDNVPITHPGFYQPIFINLRCSTENALLQIGRINRGSILEIFQANGRSDTTGDILDRMIRDSTDVFRPETQYGNLPLTIRDTCVKLGIADQDHVISRNNGTGGITNTDPNYFREHNFFLEDLLGEYERVLTLIANVAMVIVDCTNVFDDILHMDDIIKMLKNVYGDLDDLLVVVVYSFADFPQIGTDNKEDARELVNNNLKDKWKDSISWLDVSSDMDEIPEQPGNVELKIKKLE